MEAAHPPGGWDHHIPQVVLEVPGEKELRAVTEKLTEAGVQVKVREWLKLFKVFPFGKLVTLVSPDLPAQIVGGTARKLPHLPGYQTVS